MHFVFAAILICAIISMVLDWLDDFWYYHVFPYYNATIVFIDNNFYIVMSVLCFMSFLFCLVYLKPHQAEKYFIQYKNDRITRDQAITKIANTVHKHGSGLPSVISSKLTEKRISALRKRVRAEESFINDLKSYIRAYL